MPKQGDGRRLPATHSGLMPGDFPIGSLESRAAARSMLDTMPARQCICFPPDEPPHLELEVEIEAAKAVRCPLHGARFSRLAPKIFRSPRYIVPAHLQDESWLSWHSTQYQKALRASFPADRFPAIKVEQADRTVAYVLKDRTEIHRLPPPHLVFDYETGKPCGCNGRRGQVLPLDTYPLKGH